MATFDGDPLPYWHPDSEFQQLCAEIAKQYGPRIRASIRKNWRAEKANQDEQARRFGLSTTE